jgi:succinate-semialdehyde dehydrogenase/glutarate-semialdehyde dehydrogenase
LMPTEVVVAKSRIKVANPATGEILREFDAADSAQVNAAVGRARAAQPSWQDTPVGERLRVIERFQRLLNARKRAVARTITSEAGKPTAEALLTEILVVLDAARFLSNETYRFLRHEPVPHGGLATKAKRGRILRQPYGVVGIISPWNYPFSIPAVQVLTALAAGNAVVLKPSELTPLSAMELAMLLGEAELPENLLQVVVGDGATGAAIVESAIDKLVFTGSVPTGTKIAQIAAARLLPMVLELGGKDPMVVREDADLDVTSSGAVWGAFVNAGQTCLSVERCYVQRRIYEPFVAACVEKTKHLRVGNGIDPGIEVGPLIHQRQLAVVELQLEDARSRGARILTGGKRLAALGANFFAPTVLTEVTHEMKIMRDETFGPVLPIMAFDSDSDAVRLANDSPYGLAASVWTRDRSRGEDIARQIHAGTVMINDVVSGFAISEAPHGGVKASGIGRTHGRLGLEEMVRIKYLDSDLLPGIKRPWWYGYGAKLISGTEGFLDSQFATSWTARLRGAMQSARLVRRHQPW